MAAWIHRETPREELAGMLEPLVRRMHAHPVPPAYVGRRGDEQIAAAYFTRLPGQVAMLGGVRAIPGGEREAVALLTQICRQLRQQNIPQIQAILRPDDTETAGLLVSSGFRQLSTVQHMWLINIDTLPPVAIRTALSGSTRWLDAATIPFRRIAQLVDDTFVGTLDCPELNGLRSQRQVLEGFLEGVALRDVELWEVLEFDGELAACLFLKQHPQRTIELGYMGIVPHFRGWGIGHELMNRLVQRAIALGAANVVVAVDANNAPAIHLYHRHGFVTDSHCHVWLLP